MGEGKFGYMRATMHKMNNCVRKVKYGLTLRPSTTWNGDNNYEFVINVKSDSDYEKCPENRNIISGYITLLCDTVYTIESLIQRIVALHLSEVEPLSTTKCTNDMLYCTNLSTTFD